MPDVIKGVGRKISREGAKKKKRKIANRSKNSTTKHLPGGPTEKKTKK